MQTWRFHSFFEPKVELQPYWANGHGKARGSEVVLDWVVVRSSALWDDDDDRLAGEGRFMILVGERGDVGERIDCVPRRRVGGAASTPAALSFVSVASG